MMGNNLFGIPILDDGFFFLSKNDLDVEEQICNMLRVPLEYTRQDTYIVPSRYEAELKEKIFKDRSGERARNLLANGWNRSTRRKDSW